MYNCESQMTEGFTHFLKTVEALSNVLSGMDPVRQEILGAFAKVKLRSRPLKLFHYTNFSGLSGILSSNNLRATDFRSLEDTGELVYGTNFLVQELKSSNYTTIQGASTFQNKLADFFADYGNVYRSLFDTYLISFSEEPDMANQWRKYADRGRGYCIEFDFGDSRLCSVFNGAVPWIHETQSVVYDQESQKKLVQEGLDQLFIALKNKGWPPEKIIGASIMEQAVITGFLMHAFGPFSTAFKDSLFSEENEWRSVVSCQKSQCENDRKQYDTRAGARVYLDSIFLQQDDEDLWQRPLLPITTIYVGPLADSKDEGNLLTAIKENGYANTTEIKKYTVSLDRSPWPG